MLHDLRALFIVNVGSAHGVQSLLSRCRRLPGWIQDLYGRPAFTCVVASWRSGGVTNCRPLGCGRYVIAAADNGSFRKAGIAIGVQESAISRRVRDLETRSARRCSFGAAAASGLHMRDSSSSRGRGGRRIKSIMPPLTPRHPVEERSARYGSAYSLRLLLDSLGTCFVQSCTPQENATVAKLPSFSRIDSQTFAPPESQDFRDIRPRDRGGGRFILKSSVTSCRSSADAIATFSHFPSGYVRASS